MIPARCPVCARRFELERIEDQPSFPFCSDRCKLIDLGRWLNGSYQIPGTTRPEDEPESDPAEPDDQGA